MARIVVQSNVCTAYLTQPDEDGDYNWVAACGAAGDGYRPIDEAIADAEIHVDIQCGGEGS